MALKDQVINIPLSGGLDTKTDEKQVQVGKNLKLENAVMQESGAISKRNGYEDLTITTSSQNSSFTANNIVSANSIHSYNNNSLVMVGSNVSPTGIQSYNGSNIWIKSEGKNNWVTAGSYIPVTFTTERVTTTSTNFGATSLSYGSGQYLLTYIDSNKSYQTVIDKETKTTFNEKLLVDQDDKDAYGASSVYITDGYGTKFLSMGCRHNDEPMRGRIVDPDDPTADGTPWNIVGSSSGNGGVGLFDMGKISYAAHFDDDAGSLDAYEEALIIYTDATGGTRLRTYNTQATINKSIILSTEATDCLSLYIRNNDNGFTERIYIMYRDYDSGNILCDVLDPDLSVRFSGQTVVTGLGGPAIRNITMVKVTSETLNSAGFVSNRIFVEETGDREDRFLIHTRRVNFDGVGKGTERKHYHVALASKAFEYNGNAFVVTKHDTGVQPTYFLSTVVNETKMVTCAKLFYTRAGKIHNKTGSISDVVKTGSSQFTVALERATRLISDGKRDYQLALATFEMDPIALQSVQVGPNMLIGGGIITGFDGKSQEHGFHLHPENVTLPAQNSNGFMGDGYRSYRVVYSWTDRNGQVHKSAPSEAIGKEYAAGTNVQGQPLRVGHLNQSDFGNKGNESNARIETYRTVAAGSIFYLITNSFVSDTNLTTSDEKLLIAATLGESDFNLTNNEILYTTGGTASNIAPPASNILAARKDRVFLVPMDDPQAVWYSKQKINGIALEFSDELIQRIEADGNNTALATLDNKVVVFKERAIYYFAGEGPNDLVQGAFSPITRIQSDVGCIDPNSVVNIGSGVMFKSHKGIYIIDRSLQISYIGAPVEAYNDYTVVAAVLVEDKNQVRLTLNSGQPTLVYDYLHGQWSTFTNHAGVDAVMNDGKYHWVGTAGQVRKENDLFLETSRYKVPIKVRTPWIKLSGLQGYQRIKRASILGDFKSHHKLNVKVYTNYNDNSVVQTVQFDTATGHVAGEPLQFEFHIKEQKCQSIMFEIYDSNQTTTNESLSLSSLALTVGVKKGLVKQPDRKSK